MAERFRSLDVYRFLAAALVAVGHFDDGFRLGLAQVSPLAVRFGLFVDFFFILSGFVIALTYRDRITDAASYGDFLWRRLARLWPLHLAVLAGLLGLVAVGRLVGHGFTDASKFDLGALPWNIVLLQAWGPVWRETFNVAAWSISAELFVYLLFPLLAWQVRTWPLWANLALIVAYVAALAMARAAAGLLPWYQATYDLGMLRAVPSFLLGVIVLDRVLRWQNPATAGGGRLRVPWPVAHGAFALTLLAMHLNWPAELVIAGFGLFVLLAALADGDNPGTPHPVLQQLGQASYGLYMVHMPVMTCAIVLMRRTTGPDSAWGFAFAAGAFLMALALALVLFRRFEDPLRRRLNRLSPFRRPVAASPARVLDPSD